jgi:hypothetical protein
MFELYMIFKKAGATTGNAGPLFSVAWPGKKNEGGCPRNYPWRGRAFFYIIFPA